MRRILPLLLLLLANEARAALALDGSWLDGGMNAGVATSSRFVTITTSGTDRLIVALVGLGSAVGNSGITSVSGGGLTWTKRVSSPGSTGGVVWNTAEIWTAPAPTAITSQVITLTLAASAGHAINFTVGAITGHNTSTPIGATSTNTGNGTTRINADVTITATAANNWLLGAWAAPAASSTGGGTLNPLANTTYLFSHNASDHYGFTGMLTANTSGPGPVTFGSSDLAAFLTGNTSMGAAAVEIVLAGNSSGGGVGSGNSTFALGGPPTNGYRRRGFNIAKASSGGGASVTVRTGFPLANNHSLNLGQTAGFHKTTFNALAGDRVYLTYTYSNTGAVSSTTMVPTSANLTWVAVTSTAVGSGTFEESYLWSALVGGSPLTAEVVTFGSSFKGEGSVYIFDNASTSLGNYNSANGTTGTMSLSTPVSAAGSVVLTVTKYHNAGAPPTAESSNTLLVTDQDTGQWTYACETVTTPATSAGTVVGGLSAPTTNPWATVAIEIKAGP